MKTFTSRSVKRFCSSSNCSASTSEYSTKPGKVKNILEAIKDGHEDDAAEAMLLHLRTLIGSYELEVRRRLQNTDMIP